MDSKWIWWQILFTLLVLYIRKDYRLIWGIYVLYNERRQLGPVMSSYGVTHCLVISSTLLPLSRKHCLLEYFYNLTIIMKCNAIIGKHLQRNFIFLAWLGHKCFCVIYYFRQFNISIENPKFKEKYLVLMDCFQNLLFL